MEAIGRSYGLHWFASVYNASFLFSTGLEIRVPNNKYPVHHVEIGYNGSRIFSSSERELLLTEVTGRPATLGRYFLTAAYLMVDIDGNTFTF